MRDHWGLGVGHVYSHVKPAQGPHGEDIDMEAHNNQQDAESCSSENDDEQEPEEVLPGPGHERYKKIELILKGLDEDEAMLAGIEIDSTDGDYKAIDLESDEDEEYDDASDISNDSSEPDEWETIY